MTRDDIIRMARKTNLTDGIELSNEIKAIERFAALIAAAEREACADIAAWILKMPENDVSTAIRARGQK